MMAQDRACWLWLLLAALILTQSLAAQEPNSAAATPETVYVTAPRSQIYSGPATDYYPTANLDVGTALEVYQRTPEDWLGVRPPAGSFSWVPAADAYLLPGGKVIEVTSSAAVSWIGTALGTAKQYRWQVKLKPGEQLSVLGEQTVTNAEGQAVLWYKVAPPAGEFRWIHADSVGTQPPTTAQLAAANKKSKAIRGTAPVRTASANAVSGTQVTSANYQEEIAPGPIVLEGSDYYDSGNNPSGTVHEGEAWDGELVLEGYAGEAMDGQVLEGEVIYEGDTMPGEYVSGEYVVGEGVGEEWLDGEVIYEEGPYPGEVLVDRPKHHFDGWHAIDLDDDGMRLTWLERLYTRARQRGPDPLAADPFSLAMHRGAVQPASPAARERMMLAGDLYEPQPVVSEGRRRQGGWRDPRTLRQQRMQYFDGSPQPAPALSLSANDAAAGAPNTTDQTPLGAGIDKVTGLLASARSAMSQDGTSQDGTSQDGTANTQTTTSQTDVNWYGIPATTPSAATSPASLAPLTATAANVDLTQLQVALSEMVTQPMHLWNLQGLYNATLHTIEHGSTALERGQARLLLERIEEFAGLAQRSGYAALQRGTASSVGSGVMLAAANPSVPGGIVVSSNFQGFAGTSANYDATGWLVPVIAASPGQPSHALADQTGKILSYVSPAPGLNLDLYLNQPVGISGLRGYLPQLQAGHIQAQRVIRVQ